MKCSSGIVIVLVFMLGQIHGDSVKQMEGQVTLSEEASLTINCTFSTSTTPTLFWYVQYLGEGPQILLKALRDKEKGSNKGFEATLDISSKSFHLKKGSVQMSDSAVYYCALSDTASCNGVHPAWSLTFGSLPFCKRYSTEGTSPLIEAIWSRVSPL
uniref:Ig-like domain-containing protein n=1 Tax=Canis lupus dingo TaxID=286419 RepID=A0A8C0K4P5_CANLU